MVDLKNLARAKLPPSSALRDLILSEPDYLPDGEVMIKVRMYSKLLYRELNLSNP
jgi:predicted thioredoxin/glutaredoxin